MEKERKELYLKADLQTKEFIYSGITFKEFLKYSSYVIENMILLKANYVGDKYEYGFNLLEGRKSVEMLAKENVYSYGDFCFVDYETSGIVAQLNDEEIAQLLFAAHMFRPLKSMFFEKLNNQFLYLAHDDGFFCKLYMRNEIDFVTILCNKITDYVHQKYKINCLDIPETLKRIILNIATKGICLDLEEIKKNNFVVRFYIIGEVSNIDDLLNNFQTIKNKDVEWMDLIYQDGRWITNQEIKCL